MQRRWICHDCAREWVYAIGWAPDLGCPMCRSASIEQVEYRPTFIGGDIPRDGAVWTVDEPIVPIVDDARSCQSSPAVLLDQSIDDADQWAVPV